MDIEFALEDTFETPLDLEKVFTYPEGLRTARVLVKLMMHKMEDKHPRPVSTSQQQTITNSFHISRPISGLNPTMPNTLKQAVTFSDSNSQTFGEVNRGVTDPSGDKSDSLERVEYSHVKLVPSSNADASLGDLYFTNRHSSHTEQDNSTKHTYAQNASSNSPLNRFPLIHEHSSAFALDDQFEDQIEASQGEVQHDNSYSAIPSLNSIRHSTGGLSFSSNLASIDRDFLGFSTMSPAKKPTPHPSTTNSRHPTFKSSDRPQNSLLAPQPYKTPRLCMQHSASTSYPQLACKSSDDREMLQVVEGLAPTNSPVSETTIARSSSNSTGGSKKVKKSVPRKRKIVVDGEPTKKAKLDKTSKAKRAPKSKAEKKNLAKYQLDHAIWMRILEFCPVQFLGKARLICKEFKGMVDQFTSIYVNCRKENYGHDMPPPPLGLTERQYSNLLGSKGCLEPGCTDKNASRTHWSWAKRWCSSCWKSKIEREDRLIKNRGDRFSNRTTLTKLLECIPVGMHDSYMKPHDYVDVDDNRPRGAPRLYKYYLKEDVESIFREYDALDPDPYEEDPTKTAEENAAALARYQDLLAGLDDKRAAFLADKKAEIDEHMALVQKIEAGVRKRRETNRTPYDENRNARKELFVRRAGEELPHIDEDFVKSTIAFKAASRVFRDGGTERGWQTLKPKIEKEWETSRGKAHTTNLPQLDGVADADRDHEDGDDAMQLDVDLNWMDFDSDQTRILQHSATQHGRSEAEAYMDRRNMAPILRHTPIQRVQTNLSSIFAAGISMSQGNISQLSFPSSTGMGSSIFPGSISHSITTSSGHRGHSSMLSGPPSYSTACYHYTMPASQTASMTSPSTGNANGSSRDAMSITSLLTSNPSTSHPGNSS